MRRLLLGTVMVDTIVLALFSATAGKVAAGPPDKIKTATILTEKHAP